MNRPITLRTQLLMNITTVLLVAVMLLASQTFANPTEPSADLAATVATTPSTISYQGHLTDAQGQPINTTTPMTFRLYTASTGGTAVWTEERTGANAVPVTNGLFNVLLGSVTPIPSNLFNQPLWLGITVGNDAEMSPREQLGSVPYAVVASNTPQLLGEKTCDKNETGTPTSESLASGVHVVKCSNPQDLMEVTATTNGRPVVVHMTARYYVSPARDGYCRIAVLQNGKQVVSADLDATTMANGGQGCSGSYIFTDLLPGTYTFQSTVISGGEVTWKHARQIAVFQY